MLFHRRVETTDKFLLDLVDILILTLKKIVHKIKISI